MTGATVADHVPIAELAEHAALAKLARDLDVEPASLAALEGADLDDVRALRDAVSDLLQREDGPRLQRVAVASG